MSIIILLLLSVLSIPKVWLKPTVVASDFDSFYDDDDEDLRSKRQSLLFDLIHQAIDKYANCANEHLAPLKSLANSKQYETFVYPDRKEPSSHQTLVGATNSNRNKPNIKCTNVKLCSVQKQHSHSIPSFNSNEPVIVGKTHDPADEISKEHRQYFPYNTNDFVRLPKYENSRYGLRNKPQKNNPGYFSQLLGKHNFTLNRENFNWFQKKQKSANRNVVEIIAIEKSSDPEPILGSSQRNTSPSSQVKSCICSEATTAKAITSESLNSDFSKRMEITTEKIILKSTETVTEPILGASTPDSPTTSETPKSCGCLKAKTQKPENIENLNSENSTEEALEKTIEPDNVLASKLDNTLTLSSKTSTGKAGSFETNDPKWKQHLNLLFLKLDIKAQNESNDDLKRMLDKLKTLKLKTDQSSNNKESNTQAFSTTPKVVATKADSATTQSEAMVGDKAQENLPKDFISAAAKIELNDFQNQKTTQINSKNIEHTSKHDKSINSSIKPIKTIHSSDKSRNDISQHLNNFEDLSLNLNLNNNNDDIKAIQSSPALDLNITNSQDLRRITNEMQALVSTFANKTTIHQQFEQELNKPIDGTGVFVIHKTISSKNKENPKSTAPKIKVQKLNSNNHIKNFDLLATHFNSNSPVNLPIHNKKNSSINSAITISIASNGNFKNIQVEHQSSKSLDKNMEINEKENMNMVSKSTCRPDDMNHLNANSCSKKKKEESCQQDMSRLNSDLSNSRSKVRSIDMTGTNSEFVKSIKQPKEKDSYSEPILSEIYPSNTNFKPEPPLSIYWHTIEEKPSKIEKNRKIKINKTNEMKEMPSNPWKTFLSVDYDDNERSNEQNHPPQIKDCEDYEDLRESEESEIEKYQKRHSKFNKQNSYLT